MKKKFQKKICTVEKVHVAKVMKIAYSNRFMKQTVMCLEATAIIKPYCTKGGYDKKVLSVVCTRCKDRILVKDANPLSETATLS